MLTQRRAASNLAWGKYIFILSACGPHVTAQSAVKDEGFGQTGTAQTLSRIETEAVNTAASIGSPPNGPIVSAPSIPRGTLRKRTIQTANGPATFLEFDDATPTSLPRATSFTKGKRDDLGIESAASHFEVFPEEISEVGASGGSLVGIERAIGRSDFVPVYADEADAPVKLPKDLRGVVGAFGHLNVGCTGTHVGDGLVLTAGHCILDEPALSDAAIADVACPEDLTIRWNYLYKKAVKPPRSPIPVSSSKWKESECTKVVYAEWSMRQDVALIRFNSPPEAKLNMNLAARPQPGTQLTLLGFPKTQPLTWTPKCEVADAGNISWLTLDAQMNFSHQCDTEPGSSGAVLIRLDTWEIVGVHDGGKILGQKDGLTHGWNYGAFLYGSPLLRYFPTLPG